jgi:YVTN family beta-propeller protein
MEREFSPAPFFTMKNILTYSLILALLVLASCARDKTQIPSTSCYPEAVAKIIDTKCSLSGCHNTQSAGGAAGLDLTSWQKCMNGDRNGAVAIPHFHKQSTMFLFCNTYDDLGIKVLPSMPLNTTPLSREEVITLRDWIDAGAPDCNGVTPFANYATRKKVYITNQGCDVVSVIDPETNLIMRYIPVGTAAGIEAPHRVQVSPDNSFWCVSFIGGSVLQKFSTATDELLGQVELGSGSWNTFAITNDGTKAYCVDWSASGKVVAVDLVNYQVLGSYSGLFFPHGSALSADENFLYVTAQTGNHIYKLDVHDLQNIDEADITLDGSPSAIPSSIYDAHEILFSPDMSKYFLTCQKSSEVRVMNAANDSLLAVIPVGVYPQEMAVSTSTNYLFVTCTEDNVTYPGKRGSVYIIDYNTLSVVKNLFTGYQPHGVAIDEMQKKVFVSHRNVTTDGPAPHHSTECNGRNGYFTTIDLNTLENIPNSKREISVDPYSAAFKN